MQSLYDYCQDLIYYVYASNSIINDNDDNGNNSSNSYRYTKNIKRKQLPKCLIGYY